ncbi:hypothetical protein SBA4_2390004 [Candidatus Sulfopaludibacter sp. SbA4]|nr:hypothetical protein SBA4_2390004 [Candidatus Sulfopaludibacter sp. SbA4]
MGYVDPVNLIFLFLETGAGLRPRRHEDREEYHAAPVRSMWGLRESISIALVTSAPRSMTTS